MKKRKRETESPSPGRSGKWAHPRTKTCERAWEAPMERQIGLGRGGPLSYFNPRWGTPRACEAAVQSRKKSPTEGSGRNTSKRSLPEKKIQTHCSPKLLGQRIRKSCPICSLGTATRAKGYAAARWWPESHRPGGKAAIRGKQARDGSRQLPSASWRYHPAVGGLVGTNPRKGKRGGSRGVSRTVLPKPWGGGSCENRKT